MQTLPYFLAGIFHHTLQELDSAEQQGLGEEGAGEGKTLAAL